MYQNYLFDLYGTLLDVRTDEESLETWQNFAAWMKTHNMHASPEMLQTQYQQGVQTLIQGASGEEHREIDVSIVFAQMCKKIKPEASKKLIWEAGEAFRRSSIKMLKLYPHTVSTLTKLREAGKSVYLLSNAQRIFTLQELEQTKLLPYFDDVLLSSDAGYMKPDKRIFQQIVEKNHLDVKQSIMIGNDGTADIQGATSIGMDAAYLKTAISPPREPIPHCKFVFLDGDIGHVTELLNITA